jgi:Bacterial Ig-like domain (group 1)
MKVVRNARFSIAIMALAALAACGDGNDTVVNTVTLTPTALNVVVSTNNQTGAVGTALATPLSVKVVDQNGNAFSGATVSWGVAANNGSLSATTSTTDANGLATIVWTLPNVAGSYAVTASIANGQAVTFIATATAAGAKSLSIVSGNNQSVAHGTVTQAFVVKAVDANGNPVAGVPITWATTGGGTLSATSGTTNASGTAQVTLTTSSTAGPFTVTASSGTLTPVVFNGTGT